MIIDVTRVKAVLAAAKEAKKIDGGLFYITNMGIVWGSTRGFGHLPLTFIGEASPFELPNEALDPDSVVQALDYANRYYPQYDLSFVHDEEKNKMKLLVGTNEETFVHVEKADPAKLKTAVPSMAAINELLAKRYVPTDKFVNPAVLMPIMRPLDLLHGLCTGKYSKYKKAVPWNAALGIRFGEGSRGNVAIWACIGGGVTIRQVGVVAPVAVRDEDYLSDEDRIWG